MDFGGPFNEAFSGKAFATYVDFQRSIEEFQEVIPVDVIPLCWSSWVPVLPYVVITDYTPQFMQTFPSLVFSSLSELEEKMEEFQSKTGCMYAKRHTCPWPKDDLEHQDVVYKKFAYECFHYGYCKDGKVVKSSRTGCKSVVFVSCRNNLLHIARFDMRHNHPISGSSGNVYRRNRRLNPQQQAAVKELLKEEQQEFALKEYIQNSFQVYLTTADIRNLKRKLQPKKTSRSVMGLTLKNLGDEGYAEVLTDGDGVNRVVSFTSPALVKNFNIYPEVVQIRELRGAPYMVYHFSVIDRELVNQTVMFSFVLDHGVCGVFAPVIQSFKRLMQNRVDEIETVFIDSSPTECHAFRQELPWARLLFYQSGVLQQVEDQLDDDSFVHCDKKSLFQHVHSALTAHDRSAYLQVLEEIASSSPPFWSVVNETWMPYAEQWAEHLRLSQLTFGVDERAPFSVETYEAVLRTDENLDVCAKKLLEVAVPPKPPGEVVCKRDFPGQPDDIQALLRLLSEPVAERLLEHLQDTPQMTEVLTSLPGRKCYCAFNRQWRLPCHHLMRVARLAYIPLPSLLKDSRWLEQWPAEYSDVGHVAETVVVEEEDESELDFMSPNAKLMKIDLQLQNIQEMVVSSDADKFKRRQRELRDLESRWLKEDGSVPGTSRGS
ncbi:unnamed protein product [Mesocestoides corti]|uniref:ZSWIM1/3 RNaseH-like domain-containing protein n=1 Tax=Mesocestoides corti TaxID=53468 RepID=A0A0R3UPI8_MESCO|nr:unnamed protein product [Mesocestoides corti]